MDNTDLTVVQLPPRPSCELPRPKFIANPPANPLGPHPRGAVVKPRDQPPPVRRWLTLTDPPRV